MREDAWLTGFLLSFGPQVDVLAPDHLRMNWPGRQK